MKNRAEVEWLLDISKIQNSVEVVQKDVSEKIDAWWRIYINGHNSVAILCLRSAK